MFAALAFTVVAPILVYQAGRRDAARDPRLTMGMLVLTALMPALGRWLPKCGTPAVVSGIPAGPSFPWAEWMLAVWAAGFALQTIRLAAALLAVRRWVRGSQEIDRLHGVSIRICAGLGGPVAVGMIRKTILLPGTWPDWPEERRKIVLQHELAHHQRHDPLWRFLSAIACAAHWYQPMVHWMARRFVTQSEYACDAAVLRTGVTPQAYARVLCDVANQGSPSLLAAAMAEPGSLECRVRRMLAPAGKGTAMPLALLGLLGILAGLLLAVIGPDKPDTAPVPVEEVELRLAADPFPGNP